MALFEIKFLSRGKKDYKIAIPANLQIEMVENSLFSLLGLSQYFQFHIHGHYLNLQTILFF